MQSRTLIGLMVGGVCGILAATSSAMAGGLPTVLDFESGSEGWSLNGWDSPEPAGGNPGAHLRWQNFVDTFGMEARTDSNSAFIGDYTAKGSVRVSIDFKVDFIQFFFQEVSRDLTLQLKDYDSYNGAAPATVWTSVGTLTSTVPGWVTFSADITNVFDAALPAGWMGAGDEDPNTFEPILPAGRSWTNVLQGVDEIAFSTFVPGFFYGFTNFDVSVDNIRIEAIPAPGAGLALAGFGAIGLARRRRA